MPSRPASDAARPRRRGPTRGQWIRLLLGVALSVAALLYALRKTSPGEIGDALTTIRWTWLPLMIAVKAGVLVIKDIRWRIELEAMEPGPYRRTFRAIGLGYFGNLLLPFKLGELLRVGLLKRHNPQLGVGAALATIAAERALDGAVLGLMVAWCLTVAEVPPWVMRGTVILLAVMGSVIAVSMFEPIHRLALRILPERGLTGVARRVVSALSQGTAVVRQPRALIVVTLMTAAAWIGESLVFFCAAKALHVSLGYEQILVITLLLSVGLLIPSAPGQVGTHQALTVFFLAPFAVPDAVAVSLSVVLQVVALSTLGSIGGYVLIREAGARELVRRSQSRGDELGTDRQ